MIVAKSLNLVSIAFKLMTFTYRSRVNYVAVAWYPGPFHAFNYRKPGYQANVAVMYGTRGGFSRMIGFPAKSDFSLATHCFAILTPAYECVQPIRTLATCARRTPNMHNKISIDCRCSY